jgi:hypothetical protein
MAGMNGTLDSEIAEMLNFYKSVTDCSDAKVVRHTSDVAKASPLPPSKGYRAIPEQRHQRRGGDRR